MIRTLIAVTLLAASAAHAAPVTERNIALADAQKLASDAVAQCLAKGWNVGVSVVDRAGNLKAFARADNAGPHTIEASRAKAFTSASAKAPKASSPMATRQSTAAPCRRAPTATLKP